MSDECIKGVYILLGMIKVQKDSMIVFSFTTSFLLLTLLHTSEFLEPKTQVVIPKKI